MLNQQYLDYSSAIAEQLNEKGFVLLTDFLTEEVSYETQEHLFRADKHSYTQAQTPNEVEEAIKKFAEKIGIEVSKTYSRVFSTGDFTLQDTEEPYTGFEFVYMQAPEWNEAFRGEITYTPVDSQPIIVPITHKGLAIIKREEEMRSFVKKITHYAENNEMTITFAQSR